MKEFLILLLLAGVAHAQRALGTYNVNRNQMSVSGLSSGACMAVQFHVAHSAKIMGAAIFAGTPYWCAKGSSLTAANCMSTPGSVNINDLVSETNRQSSTGGVDNPSNLRSDPVFVFNGQVDSVVNVGTGQKVVDYYNQFSANVRSVLNMNAEHGFPTENEGVPCNQIGGSYINRCSWHGAYEALNHIYGGLQRPSGIVPLNGDFYQFDQREFFYISPPASSSMDNSGYVYVPSGCVSGAQCRLHVAFHGCQQGASTIGTVFAETAGYNEVGELNNIIILYPQAIPNVWVGNFMGCWDWWGYTYFAYATKDANQILAVDRMIDKVSIG